jgi:hypothetical protein
MCIFEWTYILKEIQIHLLHKDKTFYIYKTEGEYGFFKSIRMYVILLWRVMENKNKLLYITLVEFLGWLGTSSRQTMCRPRRHYTIFAICRPTTACITVSAAILCVINWLFLFVAHEQMGSTWKSHVVQDKAYANNVFSRWRCFDHHSLDKDMPHKEMGFQDMSSKYKCYV